MVSVFSQKEGNSRKCVMSLINKLKLSALGLIPFIACTGIAPKLSNNTLSSNIFENELSGKITGECLVSAGGLDLNFEWRTKESIVFYGDNSNSKKSNLNFNIELKLTSVSAGSKKLTNKIWTCSYKRWTGGYAPTYYFSSTSAIGFWLDDMDTWTNFSANGSLDNSGNIEFSNLIQTPTHPLLYSWGKTSSSGGGYPDYPTPPNMEATTGKILSNPTIKSISTNKDWILLNKVDFDYDKLIEIDEDKSKVYTDKKKSVLYLKFNTDLVAAYLMGWDSRKNMISGTYDESSGWSTENWQNDVDVKPFIRLLNQTKIAALNQAIIDGKIYLDSTGILDWQLPFSNEKILSYLNSETNENNIDNFLLKHILEDDSAFTNSLNNLPEMEWHKQYIYQSCNVDGIIKYDNYSEFIKELIQENNQTYDFIYSIKDSATTMTKQFNWSDLINGKVSVSFNYLSSTGFWVFNIHTNENQYGKSSTGQNFPIYVHSKNEVYYIDGTIDNACAYQPEIFKDESTLESVAFSGDNTQLFIGNSGISDPHEWEQMQTYLFSQPADMIVSYLKQGRFVYGGQVILFDISNFIKVKDEYKEQFDLFDVINEETIGYSYNNVTGTLSINVRFLDEEAAYDAPELFNFHLFAKRTCFKKYSGDKAKVVPSTLNEDVIRSEYIKYKDSLTHGVNSYIFETNLTKQEFDNAVSKFQITGYDDKTGEISIAITYNEEVYQVNRDDMPVPKTISDTFDVSVDPIDPVNPNKSNTRLIVGIIAGIVGLIAIGFGGYFISKKFYKNKRMKKATDEEDQSNVADIE
jgi:hypothetical protein